MKDEYEDDMSKIMAYKLKCEELRKPFSRYCCTDEPSSNVERLPPDYQAHLDIDFVECDDTLESQRLWWNRLNKDHEAIEELEKPF